MQDTILSSVWNHSQSPSQSQRIAFEEYQGEKYSYFQLWQFTCQYHQYISKHPSETHRVALLLPRGIHFIAALLGTWLSQRTAIIIDPSLPQMRIQRVIQDSLPDCIIKQSISLCPDEIGITPPDTSPDSPAYIIYSSGSSGK